MRRPVRWSGSSEFLSVAACRAGKLAGVARIELALVSGNLAAAEAEATRLRAVVQLPERKIEQPWQAAPRLLKLYGELLSAQGRFPEALEMLQTALSAAQAQQASPLQWRVQAALGRCWRAQRRFDAADTRAACGG